MSFLIRLDQKLLAICTWVAHAFQLLTGRTNYFLAKIGVVIASIGVTLDIGNYFHPLPHHKPHLLSAMIGIVYLPLIAYRASQLDKADKHSSSSAERVGIPGITDASSPWWRLLCVSFAVQDTLWAWADGSINVHGFVDTIWTVSFSYGLVIFYYFVEVEPLRPQKSLVRKLVEKFSFNIAQPAPVGSK